MKRTKWKARGPKKVRTLRNGTSRQPRYKVVGTAGEPCSRCGEPTQVREHTEITEKHLAQPFYYSRWFFCTNRQCRTQLIMPSKFIVWGESGPKRDVALERAQEQLRPPPGAL